MSEKENQIFTQRNLCFGAGFVAMIVLALMMFYPALLTLIFGGSSLGNIDGSAPWSLPVLLMALIMSGWFMFGFLALLQPELISRILPGVLRKNLWREGTESPTDAHQNFVNGRTFVLGSLAGKTLIWSPAVFGGFLMLPFIFGYLGMFSVLSLILSSLFFIALFLRLFMPGVLSSILGTPGLTPISAWPFVWGVLMSGILAAILGLTGYLPFAPQPIQTVDRDHYETQTGPAIGERTRQNNNTNSDEDARHYVTWKDDEFVEVETAFCANGMSVFLPKDKGYIGTSADPDSVAYDPYASGSDAIGIGGSSHNKNGSQRNITKNQNVSTATGSGASTTRDDAEVSTEAIQANPDWVRDLGAPWGLGSVVYKGEEKLSGHDFIEGAHIFTAQAFITSPDRTEIETKALLVPTGCVDNYIAGISMRRQLMSQIQGAAILVADLGLSNSDFTNASLITDIPIFDLEYLDKCLEEIDKLIAKQGRRKGAVGPPIIMVARWTREQESENRKIEEAKFRKTLAARQRSNVVWLSAGQLSPYCNIPQSYCAALNNSTTVYTAK